MSYPETQFERLRRWDDLPASSEVDNFERRLVAIHAHPDDEASKGAATIARYAAAGVRTALVCCTGGEAGELLNSDIDASEIGDSMTEVRLAELEESVEACGFTEAFLLGYRDSGMADSDENLHDDAFANADYDEALERIVAILRAERPQVLLGYDAHDYYPHPDHVMVHRLSTDAYDAAADPDRFPDAGPPWRIGKLYHYAGMFSKIVAWHRALCEAGFDSMFAQWIDAVDDAALESIVAVTDAAVTTRIDVASTIGAARRALEAHRTQIPADGWWLQLPDEVVSAAAPYDDYQLIKSTLVSPPTADDREVDLFAGVDAR